MEKFEYTQHWYENSAHEEIKDPNYKPNPENFHPERDKRCLQDLGVKPEHTILVLGCGGGDNIWLLDKEFKCRKIIGADWSSTAVDFCNSYFPWVTAYRTCVSDLPFPDGMFDRVCALDVTEHLSFDRYIFALMEAYRVLKPGGQIAVLPGMTKRPEHINLMTLKLIEYHLTRLGFKILKMTTKITEEWIIAAKPSGHVIGEGMFDILNIDTPPKLLFIASGTTKPPEAWLDIPSIRTNNKTIGKYPSNPLYGVMTWPGGEPKGEGLGGVCRSLGRYQPRMADSGPYIFVFDNTRTEYAVDAKQPRNMFWFGMKDQYQLPALKDYLDLCKRFKHAPRVSTGFYIVFWLLYAPVEEIYISGYDGYKVLSGLEPGLWDVTQKYRDCNDKVWCEGDYNTIERNRNEDIPDPCWYHNLTIEWMAIEQAIDKAVVRGVKVFVAKENENGT